MVPSNTTWTQPPQTKPDLLIVDDDPLITDTLDFVLGRDFNVYVAESRAQVKSVLRQLETPPELALVDLGLPPTPHRPDEGFRLINELLALSPDIKILVLSGQNDENNARHARALGAIEFVAKPCEPQRLKQLLLKARTITAAERVAGGGDAGHHRQRRRHRQAASSRSGSTPDSPFPVLIEGESGSGKELVAASLHRQSPRAMKPYLALNCAAISPNLVEATLFGHAKGAFTGATTARAGYFEDARDGTLCSSTRSASCRWSCRRSCCACWRTASTSASARPRARHQPRAHHCRHQPRPAPERSRLGGSAPISITGSSVFTIAVPPLRDLGEDKRRLLRHFSRVLRAAGRGGAVHAGRSVPSSSGWTTLFPATCANCATS